MYKQLSSGFIKNRAFVFAGLWLLLFVLYLPAARAGFVADFTGWLDDEQHSTFWDIINRTHYSVKSFYQFTQFVTYILYHILGTSKWAWHLLFVTLQAINAWLLMRLAEQLLTDAAAANARNISFTGAVLFCLSPYISEVVVWEPAYHFLQGLLFILGILLLVTRFMHTGRSRYAVWAAVIYFASVFTHEIFYTTPWLALFLILFYHRLPGFDKKRSRRAIILFFVPAISMFIFRLVLFKLIVGDWVSRVGADIVNTANFTSFGKPAKYLFNLLFLGRFFPDHTRKSIYELCDSTPGIITFYAIIILVFLYGNWRFKHMGGKGKVAILLLVWIMITLLLLVPVWFQDSMLVVVDRYVYFTAAFFYMLVAILVSLVSRRAIQVTLLAIYAAVNIRFTIMVNRLWWKSAQVTSSLLQNIPAAHGKTILLLNLPQCMGGVPMIGAGQSSEYKLMHNLLLPDSKIQDTVYDVRSYNMYTPTDGAYVTVLNDSTIRVSLTKWGTWWWYGAEGGSASAYYKMNMVDAGHHYELTLKKPADQYLLLYEVGAQWKTVNMSLKNTDQN